MHTLRRCAYARAGLVGNPSDGFHGKTVSVIVRNFRAKVTLYEWPETEILWCQEDHSRFDSVDDLVRDVELHGYYGGIRLVKATIKRFVEHCRDQALPLHDRNFTVRYETNIPRQVGLAGSSAIIVATLRALTSYYDVEIPPDVQPSLVLSVETDELGIPAGLQDRVIQVFEGLVFMDFARERMTEKCGLQCGVYEPLDAALLPPLYLAYDTDAGEDSSIAQTPLRVLFKQGDPDVVAAMKHFADLAVEARGAILERNTTRLRELMDENFDTRNRICNLPEKHVGMVHTARRVGACAKFAGSGGAIVGIYDDDQMLARLQTELAAIGCRAEKLLVGG